MVNGGVDEVGEEDGSFTEGHDEGELRERVLIKEVLYELL